MSRHVEPVESRKGAGSRGLYVEAEAHHLTNTFGRTVCTGQVPADGKVAEINRAGSCYQEAPGRRWFRVDRTSENARLGRRDEASRGSLRGTGGRPRGGRRRRAGGRDDDGYQRAVIAVRRQRHRVPVIASMSMIRKGQRPHHDGNTRSSAPRRLPPPGRRHSANCGQGIEGFIPICKK